MILDAFIKLVFGLPKDEPLDGVTKILAMGVLFMISLIILLFAF